MRIAIFHDLPSGGAKRTLFEKVQRLSANHHLEVFVPGTANETFCDIRPWVKDYRVYPLTAPKLLESPFGRFNQLSRWFHLQNIKKLSRQIAGDIDSEGYDVVWVEPSQWTQAPLVLLYLKTPSLYCCHEAPRHLYESINIGSQSTGKLPWLNKIDPLIRLYRQTARELDRQATRSAIRVLVNSKFSQKNLESLYSREVEICYNGVDTDVFRLDESCPKQSFILSVGALQPLKGFDFLIESVSLIPESKQPLLKILGNSETPGYRASLEMLAEEKGVNLCIEVGLPLNELVCQYNQAAIFVYAPYNEPFGLAPLEAMACGSPVLGVAEGGVLETVVDGVNGRLLPRNPRQFANAIESWLDDPQLTRKMAENGREYILQKWSWQKAVADMESFLMKTAGSATNKRTIVPGSAG